MRVKGDGLVFCCSVAFFFLPHEIVNYLFIPLPKMCTFFKLQKLVSWVVTHWVSISFHFLLFVFFCFCFCFLVVVGCWLGCCSHVVTCDIHSIFLFPSFRFTRLLPFHLSSSNEPVAFAWGLTLHLYFFVFEGACPPPPPSHSCPNI